MPLRIAKIYYSNVSVYYEPIKISPCTDVLGLNLMISIRICKHTVLWPSQEQDQKVPKANHCY